MWRPHMKRYGELLCRVLHFERDIKVNVASDYCGFGKVTGTHIVIISIDGVLNLYAGNFSILFLRMILNAQQSEGKFNIFRHVFDG